MDKSTLSNYGWIVIAVLVLAVMIALSTPFGSYIKTGVENTTQGLFDTSESALNVVGMSATGDGDSGSSTPENLNHSGTIPEGATYVHYVNGYFDETDSSWGWNYDDIEIYTAGDKFPELVKGDIYSYGDYTYCYGFNYCVEDADFAHICGCGSGLDGVWFVRCIYNTYRPCEILSIINGANKIGLESTFVGCDSLIVAPTLPRTVVMMNSAFHGCSNLTTVPIIPSGVEVMFDAFSDCVSLTEITYAGTVEQFKQVGSGALLLCGDAGLVIRCTNGVIAL